MGKTVYIFSSYNFRYDEFASKFCMMRKKWFEKSKYVRECFKYASEMLMYDFSNFFCNSNKDSNSILNAQTAYFIFSYAMFEHLSKTYKLKPDYFIGFGLGEVAALCAAGTINFNEGLKYVKQVSNATNIYHNNGGFVDVILSGATVGEVNEILEKFKGEKQSLKVISSNYLGKIVVSGKLDEINNFLNCFNSNEKIIQYLYYNYHNDNEYNTLIQSVKKIAYQVSCNNIKFPVIDSIKNRLYDSNDDINKTLSELPFSPISKIDCIMNLNDKNIDCCIEVSPDNMIKNLIQDIIPSANSFSVVDDTNELIDYLTDIQSNILTVPQMCITVASTTKNSNYNSEEYKKGVIEPYLQIKKLCNKNTQNENVARQSLELLSMILTTKGLSLSEINNLSNDILSKSDYKNLVNN